MVRSVSDQRVCTINPPTSQPALTVVAGPTLQPPSIHIEAVTETL